MQIKLPIADDNLLNNRNQMKILWEAQHYKEPAFKLNVVNPLLFIMTVHYLNLTLRVLSYVHGTQDWSL